MLRLLGSKNGSLQHNAAFALYGLAENEVWICLGTVMLLLAYFSINAIPLRELLSDRIMLLILSRWVGFRSFKMESSLFKYVIVSPPLPALTQTASAVYGTYIFSVCVCVCFFSFVLRVCPILVICPQMEPFGTHFPFILAVFL